MHRKATRMLRAMGTLGAKACAHGGKDQHAQRHDAEASEHCEASAAVFDGCGSEEGTGEDADADDDVDQVRVGDADAVLEESSVRDDELDSSDCETDKDES